MDKNTMYYIHVNDKEVGPLNFNQLLDNGLTEDTLVWWQGAANWLKAGEVPELQPLLQQAAAQPVSMPTGMPLQPASGAQATIPCPFCGESILAVARKCRYCGEWLQPADAAGAPSLPTTGYYPPTSSATGNFPPIPPADYPPMPPMNAVPGAPAGTPLPSSGKKSGKGLVIAFIALAVLVIGGIIVFAVMNNRSHTYYSSYEDDDYGIEAVDSVVDIAEEPAEPAYVSTEAANRLDHLYLGDDNADEYISTFYDAIDEMKVAIRAHDQENMSYIWNVINLSVDEFENGDYSYVLSEYQKSALHDRIATIYEVAGEEYVDLSELNTP